MKRPLFFLFCLSAAAIFFLYPRGYTPDPVFPQGSYYSVTVEGKIDTLSFSADRLALTLKNCRITYEDQSFSCDRLLISLEEGMTVTDSLSGGSVPVCALQAGNQVRLSGSLSSFQPARNPGNFDWRLYYLSRHISYRVSAKSIALTDAGISPLAESIRRLSLFLSERLDELYAALTAMEQTLFPSQFLSSQPSSFSSVMKALLLGNKSELEEEVRERYETGGILHLLSVSGLHVSVLGGAILAAGKRLRLFAPVRSLLASALILLYWQLCGGGLSSGRAAVMFACLCLAPLTGRSYDSLSAMSLAALLFLWDSPLILFQSGFQLSFGAVLALLLICPVFTLPLKPEKKKSRFFSRLFWQICRAFCFHLGLQLALLPVTLFHFYRYPLYGLLLNLVVLPLAAPLFICGVLGLSASLIWFPSGVVLSFPAALILRLYYWLCFLTSSLPGASRVLGQPKPWRIFLYYMMLILFCLWIAGARKKDAAAKGKSLSTASGSFPSRPFLPLLLIPLLLAPLPSQSLIVTFLDVGQGDCAFLRTPKGTTILIDAGSSDLKTAASTRLIPFLEAQGIDSLDYVFISHTDSDHVNAVTAWLEEGFSVGTVILPDLSEPLCREASFQEFQSIMLSYQIPLLFFSRGQTFRQGELTLTCLAPEPADTATGRLYTSLNASSMVLLAEYQGIRLLFTGDCGEEGEDLLLPVLERQNITCHILKAGHHGSATSTKDRLLDILSPHTIVISCGINNRYRHPHPDMLSRAAGHNIPCLITAVRGAVTVIIREGTAHIHTMLPDVP